MSSVIVWDSSPEARALTPPVQSGATIYSNVGGIDAMLQATGVDPQSRTLAGGYRAYRTVAQATWSRYGQEGVTQNHLAGRRSLNCLWVTGTSSATRYSNTVYQEIVDGVYDAALVTLMASRPIGTTRRPTDGGGNYQFYDAFLHEADLGSWDAHPSGSGTTPDKALYRSAIVHILDVVTQWCVDNGVLPSEYAAGGLVTGYTADRPTFNDWDWWRGIADVLSPAQMQYVIWLADTYFQFEDNGAGGFRPEPFRTKAEAQVARIAGAGITRFGFGETALGWDTRANPDVLVGDDVQAATWVRNDVRSAIKAGVLEMVGFFHDPAGPASKYGSYSGADRTASRTALARLAYEVNRGGVVMPNPSNRWDGVPVWGVYLTAPGDTPQPGVIDLKMTNRVARTDGRIVYPGGAVRTVTIGDTTQQDTTVRNAVRTAWRAQDEAAAGEAFDGLAWDTWWDDVIVPAAIFTSFPALDDPDVVLDPANRVRVKERLTAPTGREYDIQPLIAHLDLPIPGVNLGLVEVPPGSPTVVSPVYAKGIAGGVAPLDSDGKIPVEYIPDGIGLDEAALGTYLDTGQYVTAPELPTALPPTDGSVTAAKMASGLVAMTSAERTKLTALPSDAQSAADVAAAVASREPTITTLETTRGGTGLTSFTSGRFLTASSSSALATTKTAPTGIVVGTTDAQTLTNKVLSGADNTFSAIPQSAVTDLATTLGAKAPLAATPPVIYSTALNTWPTRSSALTALGLTGYSGRVVWHHLASHGTFAAGVSPTMPSTATANDTTEWTEVPA